MSTDQIEKQVFLRAPRERVWQALADPAEFAAWFGVKFDRAFAPGARLNGVIVGTTMDPEVAKAQQQHAGVPFEITVEKLEPERVLSFRWHPHAIEPGVDRSAEPTTLVEFRLEADAEGTLLKVTESGFDQIPLDRRANAFAGNEAGWEIQMMLIAKYLAHA